LVRSHFMGLTVEPFRLELLSRVAKALEFSPPPHDLVGVHSCTPLGLLLSQSSSTTLKRRPHLVVTPDLETAETFRASVQFFDPQAQVHVLPPFDVGAYSNLYPSPKVIAARLRWLQAAQAAHGGEIFVATAEALMQKTLPYDVFRKNSLTIHRHSSLPESFIQFLISLGYVSSPTVEDVGSFSARGGVLDIFSSAHPQPVRLELFGDQVESLRFFDPTSQLSTEDVTSFTLLPAREVIYSDENRQKISVALQKAAEGRDVAKDELQEILRSVSQAKPFYGIDYLLPYFYERLDSPISYFSGAIDYWIYDHLDVTRIVDEFLSETKSAYQSAENQVLRVSYSSLYQTFDQLPLPPESATIRVNKTSLVDSNESAEKVIDFKSSPVTEFANQAHMIAHDPDQLAQYVQAKFQEWRARGHAIYVSSQTQSGAERLRLVFERAGYQVLQLGADNFMWSETQEELRKNLKTVALITRTLPESFRLPEEPLVFLRDEDFWGRRRTRRHNAASNETVERADALSFGDLQLGDFVVHRVHGIGLYQGLKIIDVDGAQSEFIELHYKDSDRLYLPVYRVGQLHKYAGPSSTHMIDKLGGVGWAKTKTKVRGQLRDVAARLLQLYARRAQAQRPAFQEPDSEYSRFENTFPYEETEDQMRAINDVMEDLVKDKPMDRLVCGDVGFGKTEVAIRAAFRAVQEHKQVAIIAPTTILTYQHYENFKKRFAHWPVIVRELNRFVLPADVKKTLAELREGKVDIIIGTHRLLSKDIGFKNLGLLIIDEEQKFGVTHKERLRHLRESVDTLVMSATPIPRTLNMSLVGIRDLSLINTPPEDRLPTRTFVCKYDAETIRKAIESEIRRGGQVFFLHNRVQSIDEAASRLREMVPSIRLAVAHGQMDEERLENTMLKLFNHELDVLVCTAIIESGLDVPRANTIFIDNAHTFGVSQLYQLRGRVGRSKERAYCYLLLPPEKRIDPVAHERLRIIQENTALGSGLRVAQYDLELRGAGDILGEDQSGHINAVGYELYLELLEEAIHAQKGEKFTEAEVEPEINLRVSALLPDKYIPDIRMRLYYYKILSQIRSEEDVNRVEDELKDQFGSPPESVLNLLGLMYIRHLCRELGVRDVSAGKAVLSIAFTAQTSLPPQEILRLTTKDNKKYQLTPDQKLKVRMNEITWLRVVDELRYLLSLCK
jgi:transcription-repair coupling factor (superfamily II helicase)